MTLIYEKKDQIAYITLNRPQAHNAIDPETVVLLIQAWEDFRDAQEGPRAFKEKRDPVFKGE